MAGLAHVLLIGETGADRRPSIARELDAAGHAWSRVPAIFPAGEAPWCDEYDALSRRRRYGYPMRKGEVGCFLAHRAAWRAATKAEGASLILEDDAAIAPASWPAIRAAAEKLGDGPWIAKVYSRPSRPFRRWASLPDGHWLARPAKPGTGAVAYLVTPAAARALLAHSEPFWCAVDDFMNLEWAHGVRILHCEPSLAEHEDNGHSRIGDRLKPSAGLGAVVVREAFRFWLGLRQRLSYERTLWALGLRFRRVENPPGPGR